MNRVRRAACVGLTVAVSFGARTWAEQAPSTQTELKQFAPLARQFMQLAKARLGERQQEDEAARERGKEEAQRLAIEMTNSKQRQRAAADQRAQGQLRLAREGQIKALYKHALALYNEGAYDKAAETLRELAVLDPAHPLVKAADRLLARVELKQFEHRLRASAQLPANAKTANVPQLEELLTNKKMELETAVNYAKAAMRNRNYAVAEKLLTAVLVQDPSASTARRLLEQVQMAAVEEERARATAQLERDERLMENEVIKAQLLPPEPPPVSVPNPLLAAARKQRMAAKLQQPVSFEFTDVALGDVMEFLADAAGVSIIPSPQLDLKGRKVSMKAHQLPLEQAVKYLAKNLSLAYRLDEDAILLATADEFSKQPMETRVFFLRSGLGPFALKMAALEPDPKLALSSIGELIEKSVPQPSGSKLVFDERSGALIATNTGEHLGLIANMLSQLDVTPIQILIEARFIELTMTDLEQASLESVLTGDVDLTKKKRDTRPGSNVDSEGPGHQIATGSGFKFPALSRESEALNLTLQGVLTGVQFETALHRLQETQKSKTLSAPRVTALNNETAQIKVVDEFNYPTRYQVQLVQFDINGDGDFDDAGETQFVNVPQDFQKRDVGILLNVTPSVGKDLKTITLVLAPEVSAFSSFRDLGGGVSVPEFTTRQLTTSVVVDDGQTVVLGGLMQDSTSTTNTKVPILGDLPLLGSLFRQTEESNTRKNLLIFITARLLASRPTT
ncbi:MAG: hypothetical protein HY737_08110 [Candidatus Omnitrophica bacterium]|nr:hypothetical protein [Candidatus Omnitrophota bacterium]